MSYIQDLIGAPYVWWQDGESMFNTLAPFYCSEEPVSAEYVKQHGCNCAGLINIIATLSNSLIPGFAEKDYYAGGTYAWFEYLSKRGLLQPLTMKSYPAGTLLFRKYRNPEDQGHVAILYTSGPLLEQKLLHSYAAAGIKIDSTVAESHNWVPEGYYEYASENWLCVKV